MIANTQFTGNIRCICEPSYASKRKAPGEKMPPAVLVLIMNPRAQRHCSARSDEWLVR